MRAVIPHPVGNPRGCALLQRPAAEHGTSGQGSLRTDSIDEHSVAWSVCHR